MRTSHSEALTSVEGWWHEWPQVHAALGRELKAQEPLNRGRWQTLDVSQSTAHDTYELTNVTLALRGSIHTEPEHLALALGADLPWAEDHFRERVGGQPINPGEAWQYWPYHRSTPDLHRTVGGQKFDHNYMERFWPKGANGRSPETLGIRFPWGDLGDVCDQLARDPLTRQAYLPVFFPEDTGATQGQRVPCTLGYHFLVTPFSGTRQQLNLQYTLRSCDYHRHLANDLYLAHRLGQWVADRAHLQVETLQLTVHIASLHWFRGDAGGES